MKLLFSSFRRLCGSIRNVQESAGQVWHLSSKSEKGEGEVPVTVSAQGLEDFSTIGSG